MTAARTVKPDTVGVRAVDAAREALLELVDAADVGEHLGYVAEDERVVTHLFACARAGLPRLALGGHRRPGAAPEDRDRRRGRAAPRRRGDHRPEWLPYRDRIQPGDLSPGDLLPTEEDDPRLVPATSPATPRDESSTRTGCATSSTSSGLGRARVLSLGGPRPGRRALVRRQPRPDSPLAQSAPATCETCGFLVRLAGPLN